MPSRTLARAFGVSSGQSGACQCPAGRCSRCDGRRCRGATRLARPWPGPGPATPWGCLGAQRESAFRYLRPFAALAGLTSLPARCRAPAGRPPGCLPALAVPCPPPPGPPLFPRRFSLLPRLPSTSTLHGLPRCLNTRAAPLNPGPRPSPSTGPARLRPCMEGASTPARRVASAPCLCLRSARCSTAYCSSPRGQR